MQSAQKRRPRRIALWAGIVAKPGHVTPRREPSGRRSMRVVRWIGARSRREQGSREDTPPPSSDGDNVVILKWSDTFGRPETSAVFRRVSLASVIAFCGSTLAAAGTAGCASGRRTD